MSLYVDGIGFEPMKSLRRLSYSQLHLTTLLPINFQSTFLLAFNFKKIKNNIAVCTLYEPRLLIIGTLRNNKSGVLFVKVRSN